MLFQRILAARTARPEMRIVVIDPRRTATAEAADLHLALRPGSDVALFNGLLAHLADADCADQIFIDNHTDGLDAALSAARAPAGCLRPACGRHRHGNAAQTRLLWRSRQLLP